LPLEPPLFVTRIYMLRGVGADVDASKGTVPAGGTKVSANLT
jgi:hypothetical protein